MPISYKLIPTRFKPTNYDVIALNGTTNTKQTNFVQPLNPTETYKTRTDATKWNLNLTTPKSGPYLQ
jgi:hypothetical protein